MAAPLIAVVCQIEALQMRVPFQRPDSRVGHGLAVE